VGTRSASNWTPKRERKKKSDEKETKRTSNKKFCSLIHVNFVFGIDNKLSNYK